MWICTINGLKYTNQIRDDWSQLLVMFILKEEKNVDSISFLETEPRKNLSTLVIVIFLGYSFIIESR